MRGVGLAPSPNWYCSQISDCSYAGIFAFGAKHDIVLLRLGENESQDETDGTTWRVNPQFAGLLTVHRNRVSGLSFCRNSGKSPVNWLATSGDDNLVNIVDIFSLEVLYKHDVHQARITCVSWVTSTFAETVITGDESGCVLLFLCVANKIKIYQPRKTAVTCLSSCPHKSDLVAIGYKDGQILLCHASDMMKIHILKHHDDEVSCLSWAPFAGFGCCKLYYDFVEQRHSEQDCLLASASKDRSIRIWSSLYGEPLKKLEVTGSSTKGQRQWGPYSNPQQARVWVTVHWPNHCPNILLGNNGADILSWSLDNEKMESSVMGGIHLKGHQRLVFGICSMKNFAFSVSMDRQIIIWDIGESKTIVCIPTLGGCVYSLHASPLHSGLLAIGVGDSQIRLWHLTSTNSSYDCSVLWQGIKSKVSKIVWHPNKEGWLAYGTDEGRVGVYDTLSKKTPVIFKTFHKNIVYSLCWGPIWNTYHAEGKLVLYSCGAGIILMHDLQCPDKSSERIDKMLPSKQKEYTEICWKHDFVFFCTGSSDGTIEIFSFPGLKLVTCIAAQKKQIYCLKWHPTFTSASTIVSKYSGWFAASSVDTAVHLYDLSDIKAAVKMDSSNNFVERIASSKVQLCGHRARVAYLAWNPHVDGQLATASYDGTVRIWDMLTASTLAVFCGHNSRVFALEWSPLNPSVIYSGSEDFTVQQWNISDHPPPMESEIDNKGMKHSRKFESKSAGNAAAVMVQNKDALKLQTDNDDKLPKPAKIAVAQSSQLEDSTTKKKKKKPYVKSLFPASSALENRGKKFSLEDCKLLADKYSAELLLDEESVTRHTEVTHGKGNFAHLGFFSDRVAGFNLLSTEANYHTTSGNVDYAFQLEMWKANVVETLKEAQEKRNLSDWLIGMAPIVSTKFWGEMCESYARQLVDDAQPLRAVLYLLAVNKVEAAIDVLKKHVSYREAVALAKVRFPSEHPIVKNLLEEWASLTLSEGNYDLAAKCYLGAGDGVEAAKCLAKKRDALSLQTAAYVARKFGAEDSMVYATQCIIECLHKCDWNGAYEMIKEDERFNAWNLLVATNETVTKMIEACVTCPSVPVFNTETNIFKTLIDEWESLGFLAIALQVDNISLLQNSCKHFTYIPLVQNQFVTKLSVHLCVSAAAQVHSTKMEYLKHVLTCCEISHAWDNGHLLHVVCCAMMPEGVKHLQSTSQDEEATERNILRSIEAYYWKGYLLNVLKFVEKPEEIDVADNAVCEGYLSQIEDLIPKVLVNEEAQYALDMLRLTYMQKEMLSRHLKQKLGNVEEHCVNNEEIDLKALPVDNLRLDCVASTTIQREVQIVSEQLMVNKETKDLSFPDPLATASLIMEILHKMDTVYPSEAGKNLKMSTSQWALKYSGLSVQREMFNIVSNDSV